ncbi:MAG TPA: histidine kinase [Bacteroidia bacterium]|nr:histidine kinase [Bacteroidia bacterium]
MRLYLICTFCIVGFHSQAQEAIDSIKKLLVVPESNSFKLQDTNLLLDYWNLSAEYFKYGESDSMNKYASQGLTLTMRFAKLANNKIEKDVLAQYEMIFYRNLGISYFDKGDYPTQIKYFLKYLNKATELNSIKDIGTAYGNIATCNREMEDYNQAFEYAKKAVIVLENTPYKNSLAAAYAIYAGYYQSSSNANYDSAYHYKKLVNAIFTEVKNTSKEVGSTIDLVAFFQSYRQMDSSLVYLNKIEDRVMEMENPENIMLFYAFKGLALFSKGNNNESLRLLTLARQMAEQTEDREDDSNTAKYLSMVLAASNKPIDALNYLDSAFDAYSDDINTEKVRLLTQAQMNFEFQNERTIVAEENKRQRLIRNFSIAGGLLMLLFAMFIFYRYRERHKTTLLLAEKNQAIEIAYSDLKNAQDDLVQTEKQREAQSIRVRIARDIHDDIGSGLTKITMLSDVLKKKTAQPEFADSLAKITAYSKGVSSSLGEIVWAINPVNDTVSSLVAYMKTSANTLLDDSGIKYVLNFPEDENKTVVHPEVKRNIYLVMKEAINNALKYSSAKNITVSFSIAINNFELKIVDDGVGFDAENLVAPHGNLGGNGLVNMQNRMKQNGNSLQITSNIGGGCTITAKGKLS